MNFADRIDEVQAEYVSRMTRGDIGLLQEVEQYFTNCDGKMLRPRLLLAAAATQGPEVYASRRTLLLATCVEMLHNVSLLHDDVIDSALSRRGRQSINARWGNKVAVLVGDYCLAQIMTLLDEANDRDASQRVNRTVSAMVESELLALDDESPLNAERYLAIIDGKTASLFATSAALGNPAYEKFGLAYGRLFQLRDDQCDGDDNEHTQPLIDRFEAEIESLALQGSALKGFDLQ